MARLVFAPQAVDDIGGVLRSLTERAGQPVADDYAEQFRSAFERGWLRIRSPAARGLVSDATFASLLFGPIF